MSSPDIAVVLEMMRPVYELDLIRLRDDAVSQQAMRDHFAAHVHPEFEVEVPFAGQGDLRGPDALIGAWGELLSVFTSYRPQLDEAVDLGDGAVALFGRDDVATAEGIEMSIPVGAIYDVQDGLVRRARYFADQASARAEIA